MSNTSPRPSALIVKPENIPAYLKKRPQWLLWAWERRQDEKTGEWKWTKPPLQQDRRRASSTDPATWCSFEEAYGAYLSTLDSFRAGGEGFAGIGYALSETDLSAGTDLDRCIDTATGEIAAEALEIVRNLDSYTEISPSGTGLRVFLIGSCPPGETKAGRKAKVGWGGGGNLLEMYWGTGRYLTVTGHHLAETPRTINGRHGELHCLYAEYCPAKAAARQPRTSQSANSMDDAALLEKARGFSNGGKFAALYDQGDLSAHGGDHSSGDLALCNLLAWVVDYESWERVDALFRRSALYREKWDREDYRNNTIGLAFEGKGPGDGYRPGVHLSFPAGMPKRRGTEPGGEDVPLPDEPPAPSLEELKAGVVALMERVSTEPSAALSHESTELLVRLREADPEAYAKTYADLKRAEVPLDLLRSEVSKATKAREAERRQQAKENGNPTKEKESKAVYEMVLEEALELFRDPNGEGYVTVKNGNRRETLALESRNFQAWAGNTYYERHEDVPSGQARKDAASALNGWIHAANEPAQEVFTRIGAYEEAIYFNLADDAGQAIKITGSGWEVVTNPPAKFLRAKGTLPLPVPERGGNINELREFLNFADEGDFRLIVAWLVAAMRPVGPFPLLEFSGGQGTAKSTQARVCQRLIDPQTGDLRAEPKENRDLAIAATNGWLIAFDNLRHFEPWLSDTLCRISTGGGFATRKLHTDSEEAIFAFKRPALWTGISAVAGAADLLDRTIAIRLPALKTRRLEVEFWAAFEKARPRILGALLDAVAGAMRELPNVQLADPPRLADFATWATAAESALGWPKGAFMEAYADARADAHITALEACPIAAPLLRLMEGLPGRIWEGSAEELLQAVQTAESSRRAGKLLAGEVVSQPRNWPTSPRAMTAALQRSAPTFAEAGLTCEQLPRTKTGRAWRLTYSPDSKVRNPGDGSGDGWRDSEGQPSPDSNQPSPGFRHGGDGGDGGDGSPPTFLHAENLHTPLSPEGVNGKNQYGKAGEENIQDPGVKNTPGRPTPPTPPTPETTCPLCGAAGGAISDHDCAALIGEMVV